MLGVLGGFVPAQDEAMQSSLLLLILDVWVTARFGQELVKPGARVRQESCQVEGRLGERRDRLTMGYVSIQPVVKK
jgi:hypothetical protein